MLLEGEGREIRENKEQKERERERERATLEHVEACTACQRDCHACSLNL